jgi:endogenous inhibitor of DNA gyrase (YacG/DUF329 family)
MLRNIPDWCPKKSVYVCTICGKRVEWEGPLPTVYPFCSHRCKLVDLGKWLREEYSIDYIQPPQDHRPDQQELSADDAA